MRMVPKSCRHAVTWDSEVATKEGYPGTPFAMGCPSIWQWHVEDLLKAGKAGEEDQSGLYYLNSGFKIPSFLRSRKVNDRNDQSSWKSELRVLFICSKLSIFWDHWCKVFPTICLRNGGRAMLGHREWRHRWWDHTWDLHTYGKAWKQTGVLAYRNLVGLACQLKSGLRFCWGKRSLESLGSCTWWWICQCVTFPWLFSFSGYWTEGCQGLVYTNAPITSVCS